MNIQWYPGHMTKTRRQIEEMCIRDRVLTMIDRAVMDGGSSAALETAVA